MYCALIDITKVDETQFIARAELRQASILKKIYEKEGRKVVVIDCDGSSRQFAKFTNGQLCRLWLDAFKEPVNPVKDGMGNVMAMLAGYAKEKLPIDETPLADLERELHNLYPNMETREILGGAPVTQPVATAASSSGGGGSAPKKGVTKRVWEIADSLMVGTTLPSSREVKEKAVAEGIDPSTATTQYSRWKKSKLSA